MLFELTLFFLSQQNLVFHFQSTGWLQGGLSLSSFWDLSDEYQDALGT